MQINTSIKITLLVILAAALLMLPGCGSKKEFPIATDKGEQIVISERDIGSSDYPYGFYVLRDAKNRTFTPLMKDVQGYTDLDINPNSNSNINLESGRYLWWLDRENKKGAMLVHEKLIPVVTDDTPLVAIYNYNKEVPQVCLLEQYAYIGYTLGTKFYIGEDDKTVYFSISKDDLMQGSSVQRAMSKADDDNDDLVEMISINGIPAEDIISNIDTEVGIMTGFSKSDYGKYYDIDFYLGTKTCKMQPVVDVQAFKSLGIMELSSPFKKTKQDYYIVKLPENLEEGYYYINNFGMFKYEPGDRNK